MQAVFLPLSLLLTLPLGTGQCAHLVSAGSRCNGPLTIDSGPCQPTLTFETKTCTPPGYTSSKCSRSVAAACRGLSKNLGPCPRSRSQSHTIEAIARTLQCFTPFVECAHCFFPHRRHKAIRLTLQYAVCTSFNPCTYFYLSTDLQFSRCKPKAAYIGFNDTFAQLCGLELREAEAIESLGKGDFHT